MILCVRLVLINTKQVGRILSRGSSNQTSVKPSRPHIRRSPPQKTNTGSIGKWAMLGIPVATFCLGTWQIQRQKWKDDLIEKINKRTTGEPQPLPDILENVDWKELEYSRFRVQGVFDHSKELYVQPRTFVHKKRGVDTGSLITIGPRVGSHVVTPFYIPERGYSILINRGFVDKNRIDPEMRKEGQIEGEIEITGLLRLTEKNKFRAGNNIPLNLWGFVDVEKMAEVSGTQAILLDAEAECSVKDGPIGGQTQIRLWNQHLSYIITWYSISILTSIMWYQRFLRKLPFIK